MRSIFLLLLSVKIVKITLLKGRPGFSIFWLKKDFIYYGR